MKLENLDFSVNPMSTRQKSTVPAVSVRLTSKNNNIVKVTFYAFKDFYGDKHYVRFAIAGNRLYFLFSVCKGVGHTLLKCSSSVKSDTVFFNCASNKELSKFVDTRNLYTPKLDEECGLYYITL